MGVKKISNCGMQEALMGYLYNEATPEEIALVESHLSECAACKRELEAFNRVRGMLQQWQVGDVPARGVSLAEVAPRRSPLAALKGLFSSTPAWAKAFGAVAMAVLVLAVMGTEVSLNDGGFSIKANAFSWNRATQAAAAPDAVKAESGLEEIRAELKSVVISMIEENERRQKEEMKARLISLESSLQSAHHADLARLAARIQEQRARLKSLERDIDRSEGAALTDILFGEITEPVDRRPSEKGGD